MVARFFFEGKNLKNSKFLPATSHLVKKKDILHTKM